MVRKEKLSFIGRIIEWLLYMFFYALVFFTVSNMFDSFYIDVNNAGIYSFILKLTDWILGSHFKLENIFIAFFIAVLISLMNTLMDNIIIKPIIRRFKKSE